MNAVQNGLGYPGASLAAALLSHAHLAYRGTETRQLRLRRVNGRDAGLVEDDVVLVEVSLEQLLVATRLNHLLVERLLDSRAGRAMGGS